MRRFHRSDSDPVCRQGCEWGSLTPSDFVIEVYQGGALVGTVVDPSVATCSPGAEDPASCGSIQLLPGQYDLGEEFATGYAPGGIFCESLAEDEIFPNGDGAFTVSQFSLGTTCTITNFFVTREVTADVVVVNDAGGTAAGADFMIEVFDADGVLVDSMADPEPGEGNASAVFVLPIGDYSFGVSGPDGYEASVVVTIVDVPTAIIDDLSAQFTPSLAQTVSGVLTLGDIATTTSTTTTTVAPTTLAPVTTVAPAISPVLPATGDDSRWRLAAVALSLFAIGSGAVFATRRRP
jgi:hypothetical protein